MATAYIWVAIIYLFASTVNYIPDVVLQLWLEEKNVNCHSLWFQNDKAICHTIETCSNFFEKQMQ